MEGSVLVEENHQGSDSTPISKSSGSIVRIDAIAIELIGAMENNREASKCEHFSIRGYAAEMRKKDMSICLPFAFDGNQNKVEEPINVLPPLHVAKFRWWRCQNCQREIGSSTSAAEEIGIVRDRLQSGVISCSTCPHISPSDAALLLSDSQRAPELDNFAGRKTDGNSSANVNEDQIRLSSGGYNKEDNHEVGHAAVVGQGNCAGNDANHETRNPTHDITKSDPCYIQERCEDGPYALVSKSCGSVEFFAPNYRIHDIKSLGWIGNTSAKICKSGTLISADGDQRIASMACETSEVAGTSSQGLIFSKGQTSKLPSLDLQENYEILSGNSPRDPHMDSPSSLIRQKTRKVRLLTELLGSKGTSESNRVRTEGGPSGVMHNTSDRLYTVSAFNDPNAFEGSPTRHFECPKGKRKLSEGKEGKQPLELICPSKLTKKARLFKEGAEITNRTIVIADCESGKDPSARVDLQSDIRSRSAGDRIDRNAMPGKRKNKQIQLGGGYSLSLPQRGVMPKTNKVKIGDAEKYCAAADGGLSKSAHSAFTSSGKPYFSSSLSPQQADRKSSLCKKKNKQVGVGRACLVPKRTNVLGEGSIMRKGLDIMETKPSSHDAIPGKGLDLSLTSYAVAQGNEKGGIAKSGDGIDLLFPQRKGTPREDPHQRKVVTHIGESSVSHESVSDRFFRKGLHCDLNENITANRTSPLHEMQNLVPRVENGSFSRHQQLDFSGAHSTKSTVEVQEQGNDDIPMEIVELLARNQYERSRHETERNFFLSKQTNDKRDAELRGFPRIHGNGVLKSLQEEKSHMTNPVSVMGIITTGENGGLIQRNPSEFLSEIRGNHYNMGQMEGNSSFAGLSAFSKYKEKQSSGVQISDSGSIRTSYPQNLKWKGDKNAGRFSPTKMSVSEVHSSFPNGSRLGEEAGQVRSSLIPNHMPFGLNIPQRHATQSSNFEMRSQFPKPPRDVNFTKLSANDLEKQKRNSDSESFRRESAEYPFVGNQRGFDLNEKVPGSLDLHSNETIPAMQLLSLMDAGVQSSSTFSFDGNPKFFTKPFFPCSNHPKVNLDGPPFPYEHHSKRGMGTYNDSSRYPPSAFYGKNQPSEKSCECPPAVPAVGAFVSLFQNEGNLKKGTGFTGRVSSKPEDQGKPLGQSRGRKPQKSASTSGVSRVSRESNLNLNKQKGIIDASDTKYIDLEVSCVNGTVFPTRNILRNEICTLNRNPADFSIPGAGNEYMISGKDLKFGKKVSSKGRPGLNNVDGRKRQRVIKLN